MHPVRFEAYATDGAARAGVAHTARGAYRTPCFMPVGTRGAIKYLSAADYERLGAEIVLGNTYHLMLRPGAETVAHFGGIGKFAAWGGLTLTDSGGFQVFSLDPKVDDEGVTFKSTYDGSSHRFTPELAVHTQELLGADIQMVLDVCVSLPSTPDLVRQGLERTSAWAARAKAGSPATRPGVVRHRAGRYQRVDAGRERPAHGRGRFRRVRHRRTERGGDPCRDAARAGCRHRPPSGRPAALPDGRRRSGEPGGGGRARRRSVRLRDADPHRPPRHRPHRPGAIAREERQMGTQRRAARRRLPRARSATATPAATSATSSRWASPPPPA